MTLTRRNVLALSGATALAGGAAACGTTRRAESETQELSIITPIFGDSAGKTALEEEIAGSFDDDVRLSVDYIPWNRLNEKLATGIAGGLTTDIIMCGVGWVPPFAEKKVFSRIEPALIADLGIHEQLLDVCRFGGDLHAVPYQMEGRMIIGNRALMDDRGISEIPASLEEFRAMLREAQGDDIEVPLDIFSNGPRGTWVHLLASYGGTLFSDDGSSVAFDDGTGEAAIQYIIDLIADGSTSFEVKEAEGQPRPWQQQSVIFELAGSAIWPDLSAASPEMVTEDAMEMFLLPGSEGNDAVMYLGGTLVTIGEQARDRDLAERFVQNLYTPDNIAVASNHGGRVPALAELPDDDGLTENRFITFVNEHLDSAGAAEGGSPAWMEVRERINPEVEAAITGQQTAAEAIQRLKSVAEEAIARL